MKLTYLGTAAAEGWPAMFCNCDNCKRAIEAGGKNIRTRSQALIDDKLLIDFPADTYLHVLYHGLDLKNIPACIITHNHSDHLYAPDFEMRRKGFAHLEKETLLTVYGTEAVEKDANQIIHRYELDQENRVKFQKITPFEPFEVMDYIITPLKANHDPSSNPVIYSIQKGDKNILYANDTGYFPEETWSHLTEQGLHFDVVSLDCTLGIEECRDGHMGIATNVEVKERLLKSSCADENTVFIIHHFSHNGKAIYDEMVPIAAKEGFKVSYDGMSVEA